MDRAHPFKPSLNCGMYREFATMMATESEGETKKFELRIIFRSASPSGRTKLRRRRSCL